MRILDADSSTAGELARFLDKPLLQENPEVEEAVRRILADVRERGDAALLDYTRKYDWPEADSLVLPDNAIEQAYSLVPDSLLAAVRAARENIERYHRKQLRASWMDESEKGKRLGQVFRPLGRVAVLAPAFQVPLPSSLLMAAVPAKVAGVPEVLVLTPPRKDGSVHPAMLVAAAESGVDRIFRVGGAQAVAAAAYGTETVPRMDKIVGPGNVYVTMAKRLVYGQVGIDMLAGPSEVLVLADETASPRYVAADLLSQAEHDRDARAILVTTSRKLAEEVNAEIERQLPNLSRMEIARTSLDASGAIIVVSSLDEAVELANRAAPEHLELAVAEPMLLLDSIRNAGAVFMGEYSPEPVGDYIAGPNHILPTSGTARFSSPLSVDDFVKKSSVIMYSQEGLQADAKAAIELAEAEGLDAHAKAVRIRMENG